MRFEPLRTFNFTFSIPELELDEQFKLCVAAVSWDDAAKKLLTTIRLFEDSNHKKWFDLFHRADFSGKLELLNGNGSINITYTFSNLKLTNTYFALSYLNPEQQSNNLSVDLTFTYDEVVGV